VLRRPSELAPLIGTLPHSRANSRSRAESKRRYFLGLGGKSRSLQREFEEVIMVEIRIEEMFRSG
jgi:hypothetical protein